jgi:RND family efflux transporter MFP subunit
MTLLPVAAPFAGSILEAPGVVGTAVEAGDPLFRIADLAVVNVAADVPERTLAALRVGQGAQIRLAAYPDLRFSGRVTRVIDQLDRETRTAKALVQVTNTGRVLKPGMYATVSLSGLGPADVRLGASGDTVTPPMLSVPVSAVVTDGGSRYVFVEVAPRMFERREVLLAGGAGPVRPGGRVTVLTGVSPGERVVTRGAFTLKSEMAKASFAEDEG